MREETATLKLFRFNPDRDREGEFVSYEVPMEHRMSVLQAIRYVYRNFDGALAFRNSDCRRGVCGLCLLLINKRPELACMRKLEREMLIEPLPEKPLIKDLVYDFD